MKKLIKKILDWYSKLIVKYNNNILMVLIIFFLTKSLGMLILYYIPLNTVFYSPLFIITFILEIIGFIISLISFPTLYMMKFTEFGHEWKHNKQTFGLVVLLSLSIVVGTYCTKRITSSVDNTVARTGQCKYVCAYSIDEKLKEEGVEPNIVLSIYRKNGASYFNEQKFEYLLNNEEWFDVFIKSTENEYEFELVTYTDKSCDTVTYRETLKVPK